MQLAPIAATAVRDDGPPVADGRAAFRTYSRDLWSLPGAQSVSWSKRTPDELHVRFANEGFRRLADNVLRDTVDGVRLLFTVDPAAPAPAPGADWWADSPAEMARVVRGMPGVVDSNFHSEHGMHSAGFSVYDPAVADRLRPLVSQQFGRYSTYFWKASAPQPPA